MGLTEDMSPEVSIVPLRAEMAKSQYKPSSKRKASEAGLAAISELVAAEQRAVPNAGWGQQQLGAALNALAPSLQQSMQYQQAQQGAFGAYGAGGYGVGAAYQQQPLGFQQQQAAAPVGSITGQRTLYIGKLNASASHEELKQFVEGYLAGFVAMKYVHATPDKDGF